MIADHFKKLSRGDESAVNSRIAGGEVERRHRDAWPYPTVIVCNGHPNSNRQSARGPRSSKLNPTGSRKPNFSRKALRLPFRTELIGDLRRPNVELSFMISATEQRAPERVRIMDDVTVGRAARPDNCRFAEAFDDARGPCHRER